MENVFYKHIVVVNEMSHFKGSTGLSLSKSDRESIIQDESFRINLKVLFKASLIL